VRLRYAAVLFEETDNLQEAETVLLKGVSSMGLGLFYFMTGDANWLDLDYNSVQSMSSF